MLYVQADDACRMVALDALGHEGAAPNRTGSAPDEAGKFWQVRLQIGPSRRSVSSCSDLDEPCCVEVTVECQSLADPSTPHHREACRINKGVLALSTRSEPAPGFGFGSFIDMHDLGVGEALQPVDKADRG